MSYKPKLSKGYSSYGADMGRRNVLPDDTDAPIKLHMQRLKWVDGDYDAGGAYWGNGRNGENIYWAHGEDAENQVELFVRASSRSGAKQLIRVTLPNARFYR